jgi:hypothetical protein
MIGEMFPSDAINEFNSGRFSPVIRPISVRTTSPFAVRRILNTYRQLQSDNQINHKKRGHLNGQPMAGSRQMPKSRQITAFFLVFDYRWGLHRDHLLGAKASEPGLVLESCWLEGTTR